MDSTKTLDFIIRASKNFYTKTVLKAHNSAFVHSNLTFNYIYENYFKLLESVQHNFLKFLNFKIEKVHLTTGDDESFFSSLLRCIT